MKIHGSYMNENFPLGTFSSILELGHEELEEM